MQNLQAELALQTVEKQTLRAEKQRADDKVLALLQQVSSLEQQVSSLEQLVASLQDQIKLLKQMLGQNAQGYPSQQD